MTIDAITPELEAKIKAELKKREIEPGSPEAIALIQKMVDVPKEMTPER